MTRTRWLLTVFVPGFVLVLPLIAMIFTNEVNWGPEDFLVGAVLLYGSAFSCDFIIRKVKQPFRRLALVSAILFGLFLIWTELAVGIFG